jgi:flagellar biogenesis protein FliO
MSPSDAVQMAEKASMLSDKGLMLLAIIALIGVLLSCLWVVWRFMVLTLDRITNEMKIDRDRLGQIVETNSRVVMENTGELREIRSENRRQREH